MAEKPFYTTGEVARLNGVPEWYVRRLFERKLVPDAPRIGMYRLIAKEDLWRFTEALRSNGYLKSEAVCPA